MMAFGEAYRAEEPQDFIRKIKQTIRLVRILALYQGLQFDPYLRESGRFYKNPGDKVKEAMRWSVGCLLIEPTQESLDKLALYFNDIIKVFSINDN